MLSRSLASLQWSPESMPLASLAAGMGLLCLLAHLNYVLVEKPCIERGRRWLASQ